MAATLWMRTVDVHGPYLSMAVLRLSCAVLVVSSSMQPPEGFPGVASHGGRLLKCYPIRALVERLVRAFLEPLTSHTVPNRVALPTFSLSIHSLCSRFARLSLGTVTLARCCETSNRRRLPER